MTTFAVATFLSAFDKEPVQQEVTWGVFVKAFREHRELADKTAGHLWSPALYHPGTMRSNNNIIRLSMYVADIDEGAPWNEYEERLRGIRYFAHTTWRHTPERPRYRVVIPFATPVEAEDWVDIWHRCQDVFGGDTQDKDVSRMYYQPSHPAGYDFWTRDEDGELLDPYSLPVVDIPEDERGDKVDAAAIWAGIPEGSRDDTIFRYACSLFARGLIYDEVNKLVLEAASRCVPPFPEEAAKRKVAGAEEYHKRGQVADENKRLQLRELVQAVTDAEPEPEGGFSVAVPVSARKPDDWQFLTPPEAARIMSEQNALSWIVEPVANDEGLLIGGWKEGWYGVVCGSEKSLKSFITQDLALSKATGKPWMGRFNCPKSGRVLSFVGEDSIPENLRRLEAIGKAKGVDIYADDVALNLHHCYRVPQLTDNEHLAIIAKELQDFKPELVILDPLYLATAAADYKSLQAMGGVLYKVEQLCRAVGATLIIAHHWKKGEAEGTNRTQGVGVQQWARRMLTVEGKENELQFKPEERPDEGYAADEEYAHFGETDVDLTFRFERSSYASASECVFNIRVWAEDLTDPNSPLVYRVVPSATMKAWADRILGYIIEKQKPATTKEIADALRYKTPTVNKYLNRLAKMGKVRKTGETVRNAALWVPMNVDGSAIQD